MFFSKEKLYFVILITIIIFASINNSTITYFYSDNIFMDYVHNESLNKGLFDILIQPFSINGISIIPINPYLNFLSFLNYNLSNSLSYIIYLVALYLTEFLVIYLLIKFFFTKKINLLNLILIYCSLVFYFNIFDHQSYINFPILVLNLFIGLAYYLNSNKYFFFGILFLGNLWSFLINPTYFFISCFAPMIFLYLVLILEKKYLHLILSLLANFPFTIIYIFMMLGTSRLFFGNEIINETSEIYNFSFFNSKVIFLIFIILIIYLTTQLFNKKFEKKLIPIFFLIFFFIFLGIIFKFKIFNWFLPHPVYIEYSFQYILIASIYYISLSFENNFKNKIYLSLILFSSILLLKVSQNFNKILNYKEIISKISYYEETKILKRFYWNKNQNIFFSNDPLFKNKIFFIDMPNMGSDFSKYLLGNNKKFGHGMSIMNYNEDYQHSLTWNEFFKSEITTNIGHSLLLDISSLIINLKNNKTLKYKNVLPIDHLNSSINDFYSYDYILSDRILNYKIAKTYDFKNYKIYIYQYPKKNIKNFKNIILYDGIKTFIENKMYLNENLYLEKNNKLTVKNNCNLKRYTQDKKIYFKISSDIYPCISIFPIPFSETNTFMNKNQVISTFRAQYFFHGKITKRPEVIELSKKNIFHYAFSSLDDYINSKIYFDR